jgi:hypothetical protein
VALVVPVAEEANLADPRRVVKAAGPAAARVGLPTEGLMRAGVKGAVGLMVDAVTGYLTGSCAGLWCWL